MSGALPSGPPVHYCPDCSCYPCVCMDFDDVANDCANCGGEGFTYGCGWDWQCDTYDEGEGTCLCTRRCDWCQPVPEKEKSEREALRAVLADALNTPKKGQTND